MCCKLKEEFQEEVSGKQFQILKMKLDKGDNVIGNSTIIIIANVQSALTLCQTLF